MVRLLVCIDLSPRTDAVVERGQWLARSLGAEVWLLHVAAPEPDFVGYGAGPGTVRAQVASHLRAEHRDTERHAERFRAAGLRVTPLVVQGSTVERILEHAERLAVDVVVIGSRGHGVVYEVVVGSVARRLLEHATRPVLVVPSNAGG